MNQIIQSLQQARRQLQEHGVCPSGVLNARLTQSWQRSLYAGLQPHDTTQIPDLMRGFALEEVLHRSATLLAHAKPVMDFLYSQIRGSNCMVVLADAQSLVLHTQGDRAFLNKAQRIALSPGSCWDESVRGTNAVGTAVVEKTPVQVRGSEHYLAQNGFLHCSAVPIFSAQGEVAGAIDISGGVIASQAPTLSMARMAARMIENNWIKSCYPRQIRIHLHPQPDGLDTPGEGIVILSEKGLLTGANKEALRLLQLTSQDFLMTHLEPFDLDTMRKQPQMPGAGPQVLHLPNKQKLYFRIYHPDTKKPARNLIGPSSQDTHTNRSLAADALAALDSGDPQLAVAIRKARRILNKPIPLLIQGESGSGKEVFARAVHESGPRHGKPFVAINCGAIPETLIEAELFGYTAGAYTGAQKGGSQGRIREADGGTLFLDEIGDMPLVLQTRLLRVLQERQVTPLGGSPVGVDFALISATHCPLELDVQEGRFRSDLFYRINGFSLRLPALRERQDFDALTARMLQAADAPLGVTIEQSLYSAMCRYAWPGNLRQLSSTLQTACALLDDELEINWMHLADDMHDKLSDVARASPISTLSTVSTCSTGRDGSISGVDRTVSSTAARRSCELKTLTCATILSTVQACNGNVSQAARQLSISRETIYRYLRRRA